MKPKIIVTGHARHGKDTVCQLLSFSDYKFSSSSEFANEKVVFPVLSKKYGYKNLQDCFEDRHNHRSEWFDLVKQYNTPDLTRLAREIFTFNDIYCGMRNKEELTAIKATGLIDLVVWVDASSRLPIENSSSMTITEEDCDYMLDNNGPKEAIFMRVYELKCKLQTLERKKKCLQK